ncbi:MAG: FkbM family methyltransferase [Candidatus Dormibacteria bacterium]
MNAIPALAGRIQRWRFRRRLAAPRLVQAFARAYPSATFVEVGANDGLQHDHLRQAILETGWSGVMVEPLPYVFERLRANYTGVERVRLENAAIARDDGVLPFHHLAEASPADRARLPSWYDGIGSFSRRQVVGHAREIPDVEDRVVVTEVPALTWASLLRKHQLSRVDLLLVDVEGYDAEVVRQVLDAGTPAPILLAYEHFHLVPEERAATRGDVLAAGFSVLEEGFDTWCLRLDAADDALVKLWRRLRPGIPALSAHDIPGPAAVASTEEDGDHLDRFYDDSVPLPPGADTTLVDENPRLVEIRAAYGGLDIPAVAASRWQSQNVRSFLDLRYFRGETLFTWHYREAPEVTRRKYLALLEYVAARDPHGLLSKLGEDGAFGCWTFDFPGRPRVSRDLLQSVNEISFLERRLGLRQRDRFAVLDIGAGYGRLAHRMTQALPNLADYCCIDAIPEATFLSEFYLAHRGVTPPARVVSLDQHHVLTPGSFDLAVNIHSFSECPHDAIAWWVQRLRDLRVTNLLLVPNEPDHLLSLEADGTRRDFAPLLAAAGYRLTHTEPAYDDRALRKLLSVHDRFQLFELRPPP